jgi:hypothetical protein
MFNLFNRLTMIVVLATVGLATAASAQSKPQAPRSARPLITRPGNGASANFTGDGPSPQWSIGWNVVHATNCLLFESSVVAVLVVYPKEGGYFYTTDPTFQSMIQPACQTGNWIAFNVYDSSGDWDQIYTFNYQ